MWEHWNGIKEDGSFWHVNMNSFNHYAYGAVADWMYGVIAGIKVDEPAYKKMTIAPKPCRRLGFVRCSIDTVNGMVESNWYYTGDNIRFEITVPKDCVATVILPNVYTEEISGGCYHYEIKE